MKLKRLFENHYGTFGELTTNDGQLFQTLECPYKSNQRMVSCVPCGEYELVIHNSERHGETVALVNPDLSVQHYDGDFMDNGRSLILFHAANTVRELKGCIAPGMDIGVIRRQWAVTHSEKAMDKLRECFKTDKRLIIT